LLRRADELLGAGILASDGEAGEVSDLLFDGAMWRVCHVVARIGGGSPSGREVLLPPESCLPEPDGEGRLRARLKVRQVGEAPSAEEAGYEHKNASVGAVVGFDVEATDGAIGRVEDVIVASPADGSEWKVRYVVVDTRDWLSGRRVLVSTDWVRSLSWREREMRLDLLTDEIRSAPAWDPSRLPDRDYEVRLHGHYGRVPLGDRR